MIRVLVVHKHHLICDTLAKILCDEDQIEMVAVAHDQHSVQEALNRHTCDVVVISADLPETNPLQLTRMAVEAHCRPKVLIIGLVRSNTAIMCCIEAGASGYLLRDESLQDLCAKIRAVHENRFAVPPCIASMLISRVYELRHKTVQYMDSDKHELQHRFASLTQRQRQVLDLIMQDMTNQEISESLIIEVGTVKNHVHKILKKLDVPSRQHATLVARQILKGGSQTKPSPNGKSRYHSYTPHPTALRAN